MNQSTIDIAYCFLHQKWQVYVHSVMDWQKDNIEVAIADYVAQMDKSLYNTLSNGKNDFLLTHSRFEHDMQQALTQLEQMQNE